MIIIVAIVIIIVAIVIIIAAIVIIVVATVIIIVAIVIRIAGMIQVEIIIEGVEAGEVETIGEGEVEGEDTGGVVEDLRSQVRQKK